MNKNFGTLIVTVTVIYIFIACFIAFYLTSKSSILLENQKVIEALSMDLDEDIHELEERLIVIEAFVKDIDEDVHSLRK